VGREVHAILDLVGVDERLRRQVADCLRKVEVDLGGLGALVGPPSEEGLVVEQGCRIDGFPDRV
jgi:hypothetical protein